MRTIIAAGITAAVLGLAAVPGASAAPVNGTIIGDQATANSPATQVQWHWRWRSHGGWHWRWRSHGGWHWRWRSRGY
jgi:hypothetical protein